MVAVALRSTAVALAPREGVRVELPNLRSLRVWKFAFDMSDQSQLNMNAPRGAQGGKGAGAKEKTSQFWVQMQVYAVAGIVRLQPGSEAPHDAAPKN